MKRFLAVGAGSVTLFASTLASAALIVATGNNPQTDDNVLFNACDAGVGITGPALVVAGCFNGDHAQQVRFTAEENILANGGQARVDSTDASGFQHLRIEVVGKTFLTLILNINSFNGVSNDTVTFTDGVTTSGSFSLDNGNNFFTITGGPFSFIEFNTSVGVAVGDAVEDTRQVRIGGLGETGTLQEVPEPGSLALLALSLACLTLVRRFKA